MTGFGIVFRIVHPHPAGRVDHGPRVKAIECPIDTGGVVKVETSAVGEDEGDPAMRAGPRQGLAERAGRTDDHQRTDRLPHERMHPCSARYDRGVQQAHRSLPPAVARCYRVTGIASRQIGPKRRERRLAGLPAAQIVQSGLIVAAPGQQRIPAVTAEQRPGGHRGHFDALVAQRHGRVPRPRGPSHLLLARAAVVHLGQRERDAVAGPGFLQREPQAVGRRLEDAHRFHVRIGGRTVAADAAARIAIEPIIEKAVAGQIMVHAHDIGRARIIGDRAQPIGETEARQPVPQGMVHRKPAEQQVPPGPAPLVVERRLVLQGSGRVASAEVIGLDQTGVGAHPADGAHRGAHAVDLVEQRKPERMLVTAMRMPMAVQRGEARGRQRLVDRRPVGDPIVALRDLRREPGQLFGEAGIEQIGIARPAAMMEQSGDRPDPERAQPRQTRVAPCPVARSEAVGRDTLPQQRIAESRDAERGESVEVLDAILMPGQPDLVSEAVPHPVDGALDAAPEFELGERPSVAQAASACLSSASSRSTSLR